MFQIVVADGSLAEMTDDQIAFGGADQLPTCHAFNVGVQRMFAGAGVGIEKLFDTFAQP